MARLKQPPILLHAAQKVGGMAALAGRLGITRQAIYQWREVPVMRVLEIETITGISRHELRPSVFGPRPQAAEAAE